MTHQPTRTDAEPVDVARVQCRPGPVTGERNDSGHWEIRISWASKRPIIWPPYTYDRRDERTQAYAVAARALSWFNTEDNPRVTAAHIRAPGANEWEPVTALAEATP